MKPRTCSKCGREIYDTEAGQTRDVQLGGHHNPGGDACVRILVARLRQARNALVSIGKNTCGREPLAAAFARGTIDEMDNIGVA